MMSHEARWLMINCAINEAIVLQSYNTIFFKVYEPNVATYSTLIYELCKKGFNWGTRSLRLHVFYRGIEPNVLTYGNVISGLCWKGQIESCFFILIGSNS
jgi:PPR repeat